MMPGSINPYTNMNQRNVVDTAFLPDWMYYYPDFIHTNPLDIDVRKELEELDSVDSLKSAVSTWRDSQGFDSSDSWWIPFPPAVFDSGNKKRTSAMDSSAARHISINDFYIRDGLWKRLLQSRTPEQAKKRLIELSSFDKESVLICWLTAPEQEKPLFTEFFRRHELSDNYFGERAHWQGNMWETELHLSFYQLVGRKENDEFPSLEDIQDLITEKRLPNLSATLQGQGVMPVAMSLRFVGDLRDRYWTCHFLSSAIHGFKGLVDEYFRTSNLRKDQMYAEKQGQRKLLELIYVERFLGEVRRSIDEIITAFEKELDETLDPQSESLGFLHDHTSRPLKAMNLLSAVSQKLDSSISTIEQWEKREDTRALRSRWSLKDQERYGEKLREVTLRCKSNVQQLRMQQSRLKEQRRAAEQRQSDLVSWKSLQEARRSTQQADDVRLFTYVTIIFLPLSFSSSLFSMAGKPSGTTIAVMAPTTAVALTVTFLLLSNMKLVDRNWGFLINRLNTHTRKKMKDAATWSKILKDLEDMSNRESKAQGTEERLPAETRWYYILFWLSRTWRIPNDHVREGVRAWQSPHSRPFYVVVKVLAALFFFPVCVAMFVIEVLIMQIIDLLRLMWALACWLRRTGLRLSRTSQASSPQQSALDWFESPPRPILDLSRKLESAAVDSSEPKDIVTNDKQPEPQESPHLTPLPLARRRSFFEKLERKWNKLPRISNTLEKTVEDKSNNASKMRVEEVV